MGLIKLRVRLPGTTATTEIELDCDVPWISVLLKLEELSNIDHSRVRVLHGFPPKIVTAVPEASLSELKWRNNDMIIVQEGEASLQDGNCGQRYARPVHERAHLVRRICPSDNSCLFHACAYVLLNKNRTEGPRLRRECVEYVLSHPAKFNEETMGQSTESYARWLTDPKSWGGAIELQILSTIYQTEIVALDLESTTIQRFGDTENYGVQGFVVYTGNHFDCIAMNLNYNSGMESDDQVLFNPRDTTILERTRRFVIEEGKNARKI